MGASSKLDSIVCAQYIFHGHFLLISLTGQCGIFDLKEDLYLADWKVLFTLVRKTFLLWVTLPNS